MEIYVSIKTGDDLNDGLTWATATATMGQALLLSSSGDRINVGAGDYPAEKLDLWTEIGGGEINFLAHGKVLISGPVTDYVFYASTRTAHGTITGFDFDCDVVYGASGFSMTFVNCNFLGNSRLYVNSIYALPDLTLCDGCFFDKDTWLYIKTHRANSTTRVINSTITVDNPYHLVIFYATNTEVIYENCAITEKIQVRSSTNLSADLGTLTLNKCNISPTCSIDTTKDDITQPVTYNEFLEVFPNPYVSNDDPLFNPDYTMTEMSPLNKTGTDDKHIGCYGTADTFEMVDSIFANADLVNVSLDIDGNLKLDDAQSLGTITCDVADIGNGSDTVFDGIHLRGFEDQNNGETIDTNLGDASGIETSQYEYRTSLTSFLKGDAIVPWLIADRNDIALGATCQFVQLRFTLRNTNA